MDKLRSRARPLSEQIKNKKILIKFHQVCLKILLKTNRHKILKVILS